MGSFHIIPIIWVSPVCYKLFEAREAAAAQAFLKLGIKKWESTLFSQDDICTSGNPSLLFSVIRSYP